jgi:hypothetical protein
MNNKRSKSVVKMLSITQIHLKPVLGEKSLHLQSGFIIKMVYTFSSSSTYTIGHAIERFQSARPIIVSLSKRTHNTRFRPL